MSQADLDHLLISPESVVRPDMRQVLPLDMNIPKDIDELFLEPSVRGNMFSVRRRVA
jgi:hypothetical protein